MKINSNTQMGYKEGKLRITVWFRNEVDGKGLYFHINKKQASRSWNAGDGYYCWWQTDPLADCDPEIKKMVLNAISANTEVVA